MPAERILPGQFMHLSREIREYLGHMWKIPRSGVSEVRDQTVISDGHTYEDLLAITHERMNEYIGSEETFARAWEITVAKAYSELHPPIGVIKGNVEDSEIQSNEDIEILKSENIAGNDSQGDVLIDVPKKRGRPAKTE